MTVLTRWDVEAALSFTTVRLAMLRQQDITAWNRLDLSDRTDPQAADRGLSPSALADAIMDAQLVSSAAVMSAVRNEAEPVEPPAVRLAFDPDRVEQDVTRLVPRLIEFPRHVGTPPFASYLDLSLLESLCKC